jgi:hypothetical protein
MRAGMAVAIPVKRKGGQVVENKQSREITRFRAPMISRTYDQRRETIRFARRKESFAFAGFSASSRPKTQVSEINGGFGARAADVARVCDSQMAPQAVGIAQNDSQMAPPAPTAGRENRSGELRMRRFAHNLRHESDFFYFFAHNPLKAPIRTNKTKEIQGNPSFFAWFYLDLFGRNSRSG